MTSYLQYYGIRELMDMFEPTLVKKAMDSALSRTTSKTATMISKEVRKRYTISARDIRDSLTIRRTQRDSMERAMLYTGGKLPLEMFKASSVMRKVPIKNHPVNGSYRARRQRVTARVRRDKGRELAEGVFFGKGQDSGKIIPFKRKNQSDNKSKLHRQRAVSIPFMVGHPAVVDDIYDFVEEDLPRQFIGRLENELWKAGYKT